MNFSLGRKLGKGGFGEIYELIKDSVPTEHVIKYIRTPQGGVENYLEPYILLNLDNEYVSRADDIILEGNGFLKIIQPKAVGDLINSTFKIKNGIICESIVRGLSFLHSNNILHGDLKPENILLYEDNSIKINDFSVSKIIYKEKIPIHNKIYTKLYRPPEVDKLEVCLKSDIWALGCTLYEITYGYQYFTILSNKKIIHLKTKPIDNFILFLEKMICTDIEKRLDINDVSKYYLVPPIEISYNQNIKKDLEVNFIKFGINKDKYKDFFINKCLQTDKVETTKGYDKIEKKICNKFKFNIEKFV